MVHDYPPLSGGGLALSVLTLGEIASEHARVEILSSREVDHFADDSAIYLAQGVQYGPRVNVRLATALRLLTSCVRADLIVAHWTFSFRPFATASLLAPLLRKKTVCVIHTTPNHCQYNWLRYLPDWTRQLLFGLLQHILLTKCVAVVALSASHADSLSRAGISATHVLPVPLTDRFESQWTLRRGRELRSIGVAGELSHLKGSHYLPNIVRSLADCYRFHIAGAGPLAEDVTTAVSERGTSSQAGVVLCGRLKPREMALFYGSIDFLLVPSATESQCRVALEAMLCGVIVLARPSEGLVDLIVDGVTGFFIDPADVVSIRRCLEQVRTNPEAAERIRRKARLGALELISGASADWRHFFTELLDGHRSTRAGWAKRHAYEGQYGQPTTPVSQEVQPDAR
jgi:glycosyltransferase involved in cell wall biosynthesis